MGNTIARTVKLESAVGNPVMAVEIEKNPGSFLVKKFDVNPGDDDVYIPYYKVDTSYNSGRTVDVWLVLRGQRVAKIHANDIRDCKILKLVVTWNPETNKDEVTVVPIKGNLLGRIWIAWKLKSMIRPKHQTHEEEDGENVPMNHVYNTAIA